MNYRLLILTAAAMLCVTFTLHLSRAQDAMNIPADDTASTTAPTTAPAEKEMLAETKPSITPDAKVLVDAVGKAYDALKTIQIDGKVSADIDADGQQEKNQQKFTSSFMAPNKFKHDSDADVLIGSTGEKTYFFIKSRNMYLMNDAPKEPTSAMKLPQPIPQVLMLQNPSLALAISPDAAKEMAEHTRIEKVSDITIDGEKTAYQALKINSQGNGPGAMTFLIDPATHLIRQVRFDISDALKQRGATDVKTALLTIDYTTTTPDAAVKAEQFAWVPPQGAKDARQAQAEAQGEEKNPASELEGKPAPDFKLKGLDGKDVALADQKGSVVIVDFWATWCGPCVQSLPHLNKVYDDNKADGLKVFALDLREDKEKVQAFVDKKKLTIPVLFDSDGKVADAYKVSGIPQTVVIGKDGAVRKVFIGFGGDESEKALRDEVAEAMKAK